ncbi:hypothetical protein D9M70_506780 [compost metagenome]
MELQPLLHHPGGHRACGAARGDVLHHAQRVPGAAFAGVDLDQEDKGGPYSRQGVVEQFTLFRRGEAGGGHRQQQVGQAGADHLGGVAAVALAAEGGGESLGTGVVQNLAELGAALVHLRVEAFALVPGGDAHLLLRQLQQPVGRRCAAVQVMQQGRRAEYGVTGEGQLLLHREHPRGEGVGAVQRRQEDRLELPQLAGQLLHGGGGEAAAVGKDRHAVAGQHALGEYIDLPVVHFRLQKKTAAASGRPWKERAQCAGYSLSTLCLPP